MLCAATQDSSRSACPRCLSNALSTQPHGEEVCAACSRCWQRQSAYLCSRAESQRPPSLSLSRPSSTLGPSTDRAASAASPGRALPLARSRRVSQPQPTDSTTRRSSPTLAVLPASLLGSAVNRCVCRTHVRLVSSPTRRIPHRSHNRSASCGPRRCSSPSSRSCPRCPPSSPDCSSERQPGLWRGLAHVLGGPGRY